METVTDKKQKCHAGIYEWGAVDCDAPFCGCNPAWQVALDGARECGWLTDTEARALKEQLTAAQAELQRWRDLTSRSDPDDCAVGISELYGRWQDALNEKRKAQAERDRLQSAYAKLADDAAATPCEQIRHQQEVEQLREERDKASFRQVLALSTIESAEPLAWIVEGNHWYKVFDSADSASAYAAKTRECTVTPLYAHPPHAHPSEDAKPSAPSISAPSLEDAKCPKCGKWRGAHATLPGQSVDHLCHCCTQNHAPSISAERMRAVCEAAKKYTQTDMSPIYWVLLQDLLNALANLEECTKVDNK